jgi:hypothetical protein
VKLAQPNGRNFPGLYSLLTANRKAAESAWSFIRDSWQEDLGAKQARRANARCHGLSVLSLSCFRHVLERRGCRYAESTGRTHASNQVVCSPSPESKRHRKWVVPRLVQRTVQQITCRACGYHVYIASGLCLSNIPSGTIRSSSLRYDEERQDDYISSLKVS